VLELLNLALEATADAGPLAQLGGADRNEEWAGQMRAHAAREAQLKAARTKDKEKETESSSSLSSRSTFGDIRREGETGMSLG
jgi:hypothetical protein